jgi:hypothetical protein
MSWGFLAMLGPDFVGFSSTNSTDFRRQYELI